MGCYTLVQKIRNFAIFSRVSLLLLQFVANTIIPDHESDAFISPSDPELIFGAGDKVISILLGGLVRWDSQYFIHIAEYGYTHENTLAFFPMFPLALRYISTAVHFPLQAVINYHSTLILTAICLNFVLFVFAATTFYKLSRMILRDEVLAYRSAVLFCVNPASVFFSAPYSEALFSYLSFSALYNYEFGGGWSAPAQFGLAGAARSNGIVNMGFVIYHKLLHCSNYYYKVRSARTVGPNFISQVLIVILTFNFTLVPFFIAACSVLIPFAAYQAWCYNTYCGDEISFSLPPHIESFVRSNFLHSPDLGEAEWCYDALPLAYRHVQDKYWDVGLFRYYELKQLPNFLLAVPVVLMIICHAALYFVDNPKVVWSLGIPGPDHVQAVSSPKKPKSDAVDGEEKLWCSKGIYSWKVFVYTVHGLAICFFCLLFVNVQVTTRLVCSSCPIVYWFAAHLITDAEKDASKLNNKNNKKNTADTNVRPEKLENMDRFYAVELLSSFPSSLWGQVVIGYFLLYYFLGTVMFSNSLPWT